MTCIVGIEQGDRVLIGGDSAGTAGRLSRVRADEKVFVNGDFALGFTSSFRMGQLLRHKLAPPPFDPRTDPAEYLVTAFTQSARAMLKEAGYLRVSEGVEQGGCFLIGWRRRLYTIESDFQVGRVVDGYTAVGCGERLALGALHATAAMENPRERLKLALAAASEFDAAVRPPFTIVEAPEL